MRIAVVLYDFVEPIEIGILGTLSMARRVDSSLTYFTVAKWPASGNRLRLRQRTGGRCCHGYRRPRLEATSRK